jgi:hypothetical protein
LSTTALQFWDLDSLFRFSFVGEDSCGAPDSRGPRRRCRHRRLRVPGLVAVDEVGQDHNIKDHAADHRQYDRAYLADRTAWRDISEQCRQHNCGDQSQNDLDPARPSFVECERNDARDEHGHGENLARYKEWSTKPPRVLVPASRFLNWLAGQGMSRVRMKVVLQCNLQALLS